MIKKIILSTFVLIFSNFAFALVFDKSNNFSFFIDGFKATGLKNFDMHINNKKLNMKIYYTSSHQGDVIGYYLDNLKEKNWEILDNNMIASIANFFININEKYKIIDFDYVCFIDSEKKYNLIVAGKSGEITKVTKIKMPENIAEPENLKKVFNLKLPENIKTVFFMDLKPDNIAFIGSIEGPNRDFLFNKWFTEIKNEKWQIVDMNTGSNDKFYFLKKGMSKFFLYIYEKENKIYFSLIR